MLLSPSKLIKNLAAASICATGLANFSATAQAADIYTPKTVVELFTSQGCHSCPPADKILHELVKDKDYLGLAFHVDYWDRLGWKDTFATPEYTKRQWAYAVSLRERSVYTPQAVINGRDHAVGSRAADIVGLAQKFNNTGKGMFVPINVIEKSGKLDISIAAHADANDATLYAVYFKPTAQVEIKRGELAGHTLKYTNIVRKVEMLGMTGVNGMHAEFSISDIKAKGYEGCAFILQSKDNDSNPGPIIGATVISDL